MAATDASCGDSTDNIPERPIKLLFVPENDDESRLAAKMADCAYESERSSGCVYASKRSTGPIRESDTFSFVLYAGTVDKTLLAPKLVIHQNADEAILAADLTKAVAATLGLKNEHGAVLRITLHNRRFCLTPPVKMLAKQYDKIPKTRHCNYTEQEAYRLLIHAINERRAAWSSVFDQSSKVIDVYVTFRHFWFTVKWTGSNKLVAPNLFVAKEVCGQNMSRDLVHHVASLANITNRTIKLTLDSPAGPALTMPLFCLSRDHLPTQNDLQLELKKQWKSLDEHPHNQLLQTPAKPIELFLTAHSPAALAVDILHQCYIREMSVHAAYLQTDAELRENPRVAVAAIRLDKHFLCLSKTVPRHLLSNKQFVLQALAVCHKMSGFCSSLLEWIGAELQDDIDVVTAVVSFEGSSLQHATETMQATKSVVIAAVSNDSIAIKYASGQLHSDPDVVACWAKTKLLPVKSECFQSSLSVGCNDPAR